MKHPFAHTKEDIKRLMKHREDPWATAFDKELIRKSMGLLQAKIRGDDPQRFTLYERNRMLLERYEWLSKNYLKWESGKYSKKYGCTYEMFSAEKIAWIDTNFARFIQELRDEIKQQEHDGETVSEWAKSYLRNESTPEMDDEAQRKRDKYFEKKREERGAAIERKHKRKKQYYKVSSSDLPHRPQENT